jgi:ferredoxin-nitrite reductase
MRTRANLQFREVAAKDAIHVVEGVQDLGLTTRGSDAGNIRNATGDATAGIDPNKLNDTHPHAREWYFHILNQRTLYGLSRKFDVAFDVGGAILTLEDTNDIGFQAVEIEDGWASSEASSSSSLSAASPGIGTWRARRGAVAKPGETTEVADAIVPRETAPTAPRRGPKYVLDCYAAEAGGLNGFLEQVEQMNGASAKAFVKDLRAQHRYQTDVY